MKLTQQVVWIVGMLILVVSGSVLFAADEPLYFVGGETAPHSFTEQGEKKGIDYEICLEIVRRLNLNVNIKLLPFKRVLAYLEDGTADAGMQMLYNKDRERFLLYSQVPVHISETKIFVKRGQEFEFTGLQDLFGKTVGKQPGFFISPEFDQAVKEQKFLIEEAQTCEMNLKKLMAGRIDCFVSTAAIVRYYRKQLGLQEQIVELPPPLVEHKTAFFVLSKQSKRIQDPQALMDKINQVLKAIHDDGTVEKIQNSYQ